MSGIFQELTEDDGRVRTATSVTSPVWYRGMTVDSNGTVLIEADTGQARSFHDGMAFNSATGAVLIGEVPPLNRTLGSLKVDANGAVVVREQPPEVIHQGVGLLYTGELCVTAGVGPPVPCPPCEALLSDDGGLILVPEAGNEIAICIDAFAPEGVISSHE